MKDVIILEKIRKEEILSKDIVDTTMSAKVAWVLSLVDFTRRYNLAMNNANLDVAKELRLTSIKKY